MIRWRMFPAHRLRYSSSSPPGRVEALASPREPVLKAGMAPVVHGREQVDALLTENRRFMPSARCGRPAPCTHRHRAPEAVRAFAGATNRAVERTLINVISERGQGPGPQRRGRRQLRRRGATRGSATDHGGVRRRRAVVPGGRRMAALRPGTAGPDAAHPMTRLQWRGATRAAPDRPKAKPEGAECLLDVARPPGRTAPGGCRSLFAQ